MPLQTHQEAPRDRDHPALEKMRKEIPAGMLEMFSSGAARFSAPAAGPPLIVSRCRLWPPELNIT